MASFSVADDSHIASLKDLSSTTNPSLCTQDLNGARGPPRERTEEEIERQKRRNKMGIWKGEIQQNHYSECLFMAQDSCFKLLRNFERL